MRPGLLLLIPGLLPFLELGAQPDPMEWGKIMPQDLQMQEYKDDTSASAVLLCDYGNLSIESVELEYRVVFTRHIRMKIFRKSSYPEANVEIPFNRADKESVMDIRAQSYTLADDGSIITTSLRDQDILEKKMNDNWSKWVFAVPGVKEGSVFEYSYKIVSADFFNYRTWVFQYHIPVLWSELRVELSGIYNYLVLFHNIRDSLFINEKITGYKVIPPEMLTNTNLRVPVRIRSTHARYVMKGIPALVEEPFITCMADYRMEIKFQLYSITQPYTEQLNVIRSWEELIDLLNEDKHFGKWLTNELNLKELTAEIIRPAMDERMKMQMIYDYVRTHFRWNGEFRFLARKDITDFQRLGNGNSAEINLFMMNLLRLAGLQTDPVLISTRTHGKVQREYPILNQFNHMICRVKADTSFFLLDAIDPYRPYSLLAPEDLNYTGFLIDGMKYQWIDIATSFLTKRNTLLTMRIDSFGNVMGDVVIYETGHFANNRRATIASMGKEKFINNFMSSFTIDLHVDTFYFSNFEAIEVPLKITISFSAKKIIDSFFQNDLVYFDAVILNSMKNTPFKLSTRNYPVDFNFPYDDASTFVVQVPKGYTFEELPQDEHYIVPDENAEFIFQVFNTTKVFQVKSELKIKKAFFPQSEYSDLKLLFDLMLQKNAEHVTAVRDR